ncbi:MAG: hypothetical protein WC966_02770 [Bradymonadales bacterium]
MRNIENYQTLVIKVGSAVLTNARNASLDRGNFCRLVEMLARLRAEHKRVVLVTSGNGAQSFTELDSLCAPNQPLGWPLYRCFSS